MDRHGYSKKATVLVVDDMPYDLALMSKLLKDYYKVEIANGGEAALMIVASDLSIDLILLDIMMSGMDGYEVCRRLKLDPKTMNIPVIFLTAKIEVKDESKGFELGAVDYITKPISPPIVLARVKNHLALKAMTDFLRDQNDWDIAERLAFTLKGISGKVSINGLQQFADKLDVAVREQRDRNVHSSENTQPDNLLARLEQKLLEEQDKTIDQVKLKAVCDRLQALLAEEDEEAVNVLYINGNLLNLAFPVHYRKINDCIRSFDFKAALAELSTALEHQHNGYEGYATLAGTTHRS
jgi:response regulator RpfG family c-di-GMP phosphodiesterase